MNYASFFLPCWMVPQIHFGVFKGIKVAKTWTCFQNTTRKSSMLTDVCLFAFNIENELGSCTLGQPLVQSHQHWKIESVHINPINFPKVNNYSTYNGIIRCSSIWQDQAPALVIFHTCFGTFRHMFNAWIFWFVVEYRLSPLANMQTVTVFFLMPIPGHDV